MTRLEKAKSKFENKLIPPSLDLPLNEFILECYVNYTPQAYGKYIQDKIIHDCKKMYFPVSQIRDKDNQGDCELYYPSQMRIEYFTSPNISLRYHFDPINKFLSRKTYEIKISFLSKNKMYGIRNIRPYQTISGGYIICFIDCENDFKPEFYLIEQKTLYDNFTLTHMNGVSSEHENSKFENYGTALHKDSEKYTSLLKSLSLLDGNTFESLISYFGETYTKMHDEFEKNIEYNEYVTEIANRCLQLNQYSDFNVIDKS